MLSRAACTVYEALERDRARREQSRDAGDGGGLLEGHRTLFRGIARLWALGAAGGPVREAPATRDHAYGVVVEGPVRVALALASTRATVVAADAGGVVGERREKKLFAVLFALAYVTQDPANVGRRFGLEPGTENHVDLLSGTAPGWASRWHVERGGALASFLAHDDVVAVRPAGGRLALASLVVQLEQAVGQLRRRSWLAAQQAAPGGAHFKEGDVDRVLDKLDLLEAYGWTEAIEPLRPATSRVLAPIRAGASPEEIQRAIDATLTDAPP